MQQVHQPFNVLLTNPLKAITFTVTEDLVKLSHHLREVKFCEAHKPDTVWLKWLWYLNERKDCNLLEQTKQILGSSYSCNSGQGLKSHTNVDMQQNSKPAHSNVHGIFFTSILSTCFKSNTACAWERKDCILKIWKNILKGIAHWDCCLSAKTDYNYWKTHEILNHRHSSLHLHNSQVAPWYLSRATCRKVLQSRHCDIHWCQTAWGRCHMDKFGLVNYQRLDNYVRTIGVGTKWHTQFYYYYYYYILQ